MPDSKHASDRPRHAQRPAERAGQFQREPAPWWSADAYIARRLHTAQRRSWAVREARTHGNLYVQRLIHPAGPESHAPPGMVAASWSEPDGEEWARYHQLRTLLERRVTPGVGGSRYRFEMLEQDRSGPTRWRITPPTRLLQELSEATPQEVTRADILRRLETWVARERRAGHLPGGAGERPGVPQPPSWLVPDARRFFEGVTRGERIRPGEPEVFFFGPRIDIVRPYLGAVGAEEGEEQPRRSGETRISTPSQLIRVHWIRGGPIHLQAMRFAPVDRADPFYAERDYDSWQDWNYQMFRFVVQEGMSIEQAYAHMHAIDMETIRQMLSYAAVSRA